VTKDKVWQRICEKFGDKLRELPTGASTREDVTWDFEIPSFVEKSGQKVTWRTSTHLVSNAYRFQRRDSSLSGLPLQDYTGLGLGTISSLGSSYLFGSVPASLGPSQNLFTMGASPQPEKSSLQRVLTIFHVTWSVTVTTHGKLTNPKVESIEWKETVWEEPNKAS